MQKNIQNSFSVNNNGTINMPLNTLPGTYDIKYYLCPATSTTGGCTDALLYQVVVNNTVRANPDVFYFDTDGNFLGSNNSNNSNNILTNDGYAQDCGLSAPNSFVPVVLGGNISNLVVNYLNNTINFFTINSIDGSIVSSGSPTGTYPFIYSISDYNYPSSLTSLTRGSIEVINYSRLFSIGANNKSLIENKFKVYPNPSDGIFNLVFGDNSEEIEIEVYSLLGQKLFNKKIKDRIQFSFDLTDFESGTYILKILNGVDIIDKLIIKTN